MGGSISHKRSVLLAAIGSAPSLVYLFFGLFSMTVLPFMGSFSISLLGTFLPYLAMTMFLVSLYREASGLTSAEGRRKAAIVAAVFTVLGAMLFVWSRYSAYQFSLRALQVAPHDSVFVGLAYGHNAILKLGVSLASPLIGYAAWVTFYVIFAREAAPLSKRMTSNVAAFLAALTALGGVFVGVMLCMPFIRGFSHLQKASLVNVILVLAMEMFGQVTLFVFLVVVWRSRPAPRAPEEPAAAI